MLNPSRTCSSCRRFFSLPKAGLSQPSRRRLSSQSSATTLISDKKPHWRNLPYRLPKHIPASLDRTKILWRERGYYSKFRGESPPEVLKALTLAQIDEAFAPWLEPNASPKTTESAAHLRLLLHQIGQRYPLTMPFVWSGSSRISTLLHHTWDYQPPFTLDLHPPPAELVDDMKTIREMLGYEGLPEWDAEFEEPVDLDWTGAASIFSSEDGKESGGMGATFDDLWASWAWTNDPTGVETLTAMKSVLPLTLGLQLALTSSSKLTPHTKTFHTPLTVRAVSPHAALNLLDHFSRFPSCNARLKELYLLMARNRIPKLVPFWEPEQKKPETVAGYLAKRRVKWVLQGNYKLRRRSTWLEEVPKDLEGKLVQIGSDERVMTGPEKEEGEEEEKVLSPYELLR